MKFNLFETLGGEIKEMMNVAVKGLSSSWASDLLAFSTICITVYIIFYGYLVLAGKVQEPMKELIWNLARFAVVIGILQSYSTYFGLIGGAVDELKLFVTHSDGDTTIYVTMDEKFIMLGKVFAAILKNVAWNPITWLTALIQMIFFSALILGTVLYCALMMVGEITITALLAVFPLFLFCYLWGWFKEMFSMWIQALISIMLFCLFVSLFIDIGFKIANYSLEMDKSYGAYACFGLLVAGVVVLAGNKLSLSLASSLSKVSVSHTTGTAKRAGQLGKLAFKKWSSS